MDKIAVKINVHTFSRKKQGNNETSLTQCILRLKGDKATKTECEKFGYSQMKYPMTKNPKPISDVPCDSKSIHVSKFPIDRINVFFRKI